MWLLESHQRACRGLCAWEEGFRDEGGGFGVIFERVIVEAAKEEEKEKWSGFAEVDSIIGEGWKTNERRFVATIDEALKLRERRNGKNNPQRMHQTVTGCCESVKMQEKPAEEGKEVPFDDREDDEGCWWFRMLKNAESFFAEES